jgi:hypothetical protein
MNPSTLFPVLDPNRPENPARSLNRISLESSACPSIPCTAKALKGIESKAIEEVALSSVP